MAARGSRRPRESSGRQGAGKIKFGLPLKMTIVSVIAVIVVEVVLVLAFGAGKEPNWKLVGPLLVLLVPVAAAVSYFFALSISKPLKKIVNDVTAMASGDYTRRSRVKSNDEVGVLARAVNELAESLEEAERSKEKVTRIEDDLSLAGEIQQMLLPSVIPTIPTLDIYPYYRPAGTLGGDYYDFIPVSPEQLGIVISDVSGKGIAGSMIMGIFRSVLRRFAEKNPSTRDVLVKTNELLSRDVKRGMFVTAFYVVYHIPTNRMTFSCAGHTPMVIYRATSDSVELVKPQGMALGFDTGMVFNRQIQQHELGLRPGDRVVLYTDGVTDAVNRRGEKFGEKRLYRFIKENAWMSSKEFLSELIAELDDFRGRAEQVDDITLVTFRVREPDELD